MLLIEKNPLTFKWFKFIVYTMQVFQKINLATSRLTKHLTLVFTGNLFAASLGFVAILMISRELSVSDFGLFNLAIPVILIAARLSDIGMDVSMTKFASSYLAANKTAEATQVLRVTFFVRVIICSIFTVIIYNLAGLLSITFFHDSSLVQLLKLSAFGIFITSMFNYLKSVLFTYQLFQRSVFLQILIDFTKLCAVIILVFSRRMETSSALAVFAFAPLAGLLLGFGLLRQKLISKRVPIQNLFNKLFSYSKWLFISKACNLTLPYVGIFLLAKMSSSKAAGIYGLALNLTYIFPIIIYSFRSVLLPEVSRFREIAQLERYVKGSLKISFCLGLAIIPILFFSKKIILLFFGARYLESVPIFNWLLLSYIVFIVNSTISLALHSLNRPHAIALIDLFKLTTMVFGCYFLIPSLGIAAPAILALIVNVIVLVFLTIYIFKLIGKEANNITLQEE